MKQGSMYLGKPEGLAEFSDYPKRIYLVKQITEPRYADKGDWIVRVTYKPKNCGFDVEIGQIWTEQQIKATFVI